MNSIALQIFRKGTAASVLLFGALCFYANDFVIGRAPSLGFNQITWSGILFGLVLLVLGTLMFLEIKINLTGWIIIFLIITFSLSRHLISGASDWLNALKTLSIIGCFIFYSNSGKSPVPTDSLYKNIGCILVALFFLGGGIAHFYYAEFVAHLIPDFIPFHLFWTYFAGICLISSAIGLNIPKWRRVTSLFAGLMILLWFLLLHIPRVLQNPKELGELEGLAESLTMSTCLLVLSNLEYRNNGVPGSRKTSILA